MFAGLNQDIMIIIAERLNFRELINLGITCKYFFNSRKLTEYIYWQSLVYPNKHRILDTRYLNQIDIEFKIDDGLENILDYISEDENLCISGGYTTLQYLNYDIYDPKFESSDIDIYVLEKERTLIDTVSDFLDFILNCYGIDEIIEVSQDSIFNIKLSNIKRIIQIIGTSQKSIMEHIYSINNSHTKCCFYLGNFYIAPDAYVAKKTGITYLYDPIIKKRRIKKIRKLDMQIYNELIHPIIGKSDKYKKNGENKIVSANYVKWNFSPIVNWIYLHTFYNSNFGKDIRVEIDKIDILEYFKLVKIQQNIIVRTHNYHEYFTTHYEFKNCVFYIEGIIDGNNNLRIVEGKEIAYLEQILSELKNYFEIIYQIDKLCHNIHCKNTHYIIENIAEKKCINCDKMSENNGGRFYIRLYQISDISFMDKKKKSEYYLKFNFVKSAKSSNK